MKKLTCAILGYGDRSSRYSEYAFSEPKQLEVVAVIDTNPFKLQVAKEKFSLGEEMLFSSLEEFLKQDIKCDFVINGTMDEVHFVTTMPLLEKGYNILLEKPVTADKNEMIELQKKAAEKNCKVVVCHVLRYTPFYSTIKKIIDSGEIGQVVDMQLNEHVWFGHFVNSYVRGKWRSEKACGSGLLLAKCCHDIDLICWLNNKTTPKSVSSFGSKSYFTENNAPKGATQYCYQCPAKDTCMFDAYKFELEADFIPFYTWADMNKPLDKITREEKEEFLKNNTFGECVYKTDMDIVDRQCVSVEFQDGSIATLNMVGGTSKAGRHIHIICTMGEIIGYVEDNRLTVRRFDGKKLCYRDEIVDCNPINSEEKDNSVAGHYGGDYYIMKDLVAYLNGENTSVAITSIDDSINGHFVVYCAEESRKQKITVDFEEFKNN